MTKHIHADCIIAWANGAEIQVWSDREQQWMDMECTPCWVRRCRYRVKPRVVYTFLHETGFAGFTSHKMNAANIKATLDEKGHILSIELIKND